jgi:hypothetical protein
VLADRCCCSPLIPSCSANMPGRRAVHKVACLSRLTAVIHSCNSFCSHSCACVQPARDLWQVHIPPACRLPLFCADHRAVHRVLHTFHAYSPPFNQSPLHKPSGYTVQRSSNPQRQSKEAEPGSGECCPRITHCLWCASVLVWRIKMAGVSMAPTCRSAHPTRMHARQPVHPGVFDP